MLALRQRRGPLRVAPEGEPRSRAVALKGAITRPERYRSGRNGGASKASCRVTGTWVRIPPSPPICKSFTRNHLQRWIAKYLPPRKT